MVQGCAWLGQELWKLQTRLVAGSGCCVALRRNVLRDDVDQGYQLSIGLHECDDRRRRQKVKSRADEEGEEVCDEEVRWRGWDLIVCDRGANGGCGKALERRIGMRALTVITSDESPDLGFSTACAAEHGREHHVVKLTPMRS